MFMGKYLSPKELICENKEKKISRMAATALSAGHQNTINGENRIQRSVLCIIIVSAGTGGLTAEIALRQ
jgi:hypothetical protein